MMYSPAPPVGPRPDRAPCEYCRGTLGYDSAGTCAGCGAPKPEPRTNALFVSLLTNCVPPMPDQTYHY